MIDYRTEWRTFGEKGDKPGEDMVRVGGPVNMLLSGGGLSTSLARGGLQERGLGRARDCVCVVTQGALDSSSFVRSTLRGG